ncbi:hypothetical protein BCJMU51_4440 [Bacillus cereus]|uniref:hypothetical protein n=1 Tax=Bacillus cereus group TaxID=86661 RepID=UPI001F46173E|nr:MULTISPECIES: hypothetical protein [Bacillus cereus group]BCB39521.1 hypothetical protein BCM0045_4416 [Bacillus cereus]BCC02362.1 hypothetical protein BCM0057_4444 [Bacillus cereus]BCC25874.1 hypothetical protein BCM0079_4467 [Bacillus cereus]BCC37442.1 hypothetical protein BCM0105_4432 [Bacillus cereus]BCC43244.1 hypothetical protein BCJMU01_4411 [Bacillus cereus]
MSKSKSAERLRIWSFDSFVNLQSIQEALSLEYKQEIAFLNEVDVVNEIEQEDKWLYHQWLPMGNQQEIKGYDFDLNGKNIPYIFAKGCYEVGFGKKKSIVDNQLLPRKARVFNHLSQCLFFEQEGKVYCIIQVSDSQERKIRNTLFGQKNTDLKKVWGDIELTKVYPYVLEEQFFYWLLSKCGQVFVYSDEGVEDKEINLLDVSQLSLKSRPYVYDSNCKGTNLLSESVAALSTLANNDQVHLAGIKVKIGNAQFSFAFDSDCVIHVNTDDTWFVDEKGKTSYDKNPLYFIFHIYLVIFPTFLKAYQADWSKDKWTMRSYVAQKKEWTLKTIKLLCDENGVTIDELRELMAPVS